MKRLVFLIIPALICGMMFTGCNKDENNPLNGIYTGTYTATRLSSEAPNESGTITIKLKNGKYSSGVFSGDYSINGNKIIFDIKVNKSCFKDKNGMTVCVDFIPFVILQGEYSSFVFDGNKLIFSKTDDFAHCEYDLERE